MGLEFSFPGHCCGCNEVLYETEQSAITFPEKERIIAEIKILRAYEYYWAMDNWGNIPFVTDFTSKELPRKRTGNLYLISLKKKFLPTLDKLQKVPTPAYYGHELHKVWPTPYWQNYTSIPRNGLAWIISKNVDACNKVIALNSYQIESDYWQTLRSKTNHLKRTFLLSL
ncbi:MAG: hypothetical protein U0Z17_08145 [Bacteroidales bacterium]